MRLLLGFVFIFVAQAQAADLGAKIKDSRHFTSSPAQSYMGELNEALAGAGGKSVLMKCVGHKSFNYPRIEMKLSFRVDCLKGEKCIEDGKGIEATALDGILFMRPFYSTANYPYFYSCVGGSGPACEWKTVENEKFELRLFSEGESVRAALYPAPVTHPLSTRHFIYSSNPYMSGDLALIKLKIRPEGNSPFIPSETFTEIAATLEGGVLKSVEIPASKEYDIVTKPSVCSFSIQ